MLARLFSVGARKGWVLVGTLATALLLAACGANTTGTTDVAGSFATLHATAHCDSGQSCTWYWEYWRADQPRSSSIKTAVYGPVNGPTGNVPLSTKITGLYPSVVYRWVFCASPNAGGVYGCAGPNGTFGSTTADPPPDYGTFTTEPAQTTLAEGWDGTAWRLQNTPLVAGATINNLRLVSCSSATACTAVGSTNATASQGPLAERRDGTAWTIQPAYQPPNANFSSFSGVSCPSATACAAVGSYVTTVLRTNYTAPLAETWDGTAWGQQSVPTPTSATDAYLSEVSCTSATACTAVGTSYDQQTGVDSPLAERWDGTAWTIQTTPQPTSPADSYLSGVSCTSATSCTAVGYSNVASSTASYVPLVEHWDGTTWTIQSTPSPTGVTSSLLSAVSCTSATACTAVGVSNNNASAPAVPLAERWDGTAWTIQPTPAPTNPPASGLSDVSCTSATACTAVGSSYVNSATGGYVPLAERWDGNAWTIQTTLSPANAQDSLLTGVSCPSATNCAAVGYFNPG